MLTRVHAENVHGGHVSIARKLAKRIKLTKLHAAQTLHGCEHCRSTQQRESLVREIVSQHGTASAHLTCPQCSAKWRIEFSADREGNALVKFAPVVLS